MSTYWRILEFDQKRTDIISICFLCARLFGNILADSVAKGSGHDL